MFEKHKVLLAILGPVFSAVVAYLLSLNGWESPACWTGAIAALTAFWWITEAIPIPVTSMIPLAGLPAVGVLTPAQIGASYGHWLILLLLGGFILSTAMAASGAHRRVALGMVSLVGGSTSRRLVFGFMAASAVLSMWISNTATSVMMLPIGLAIISKMEEAFGKEKTHSLALILMLGIAYGCSIGGVSTLVGTPTNLAFVRIFQESFPEAPPIAFGQWIIIGIPYSVILLLVVWLLLTRVLLRVDNSLTLDN